MATAAHTYSSGMRINAHRPSSSRSTTPLVNTAKTPHNAPETNPSSTALMGPLTTLAPSTQRISAGASTTTTAVHVFHEACECPSVGLPTVTITATDAASSAAHSHSHRVTRRRLIRALIGSAN